MRTYGAVRVRSECPRVPQASARPSAATASATIWSSPEGSVASAAASTVQPASCASARTRRSRASITATSTSSRCTPTRRCQRWPLLRSWACAPWRVRMRASLRLCAWPMRGLALLASAHSAVVGTLRRPLKDLRPSSIRQTFVVRKTALVPPAAQLSLSCGWAAAHQCSQALLRSTQTGRLCVRGTGTRHRRARTGVVCAARARALRGMNSVGAGVSPVRPSRRRCGRGGPSPGADVGAGVSPVRPSRRRCGAPDAVASPLICRHRLDC